MLPADVRTLKPNSPFPPPQLEEQPPLYLCRLPSYARQTGDDESPPYSVQSPFAFRDFLSQALNLSIYRVPGRKQMLKLSDVPGRRSRRGRGLHQHKSPQNPYTCWSARNKKRGLHSTLLRLVRIRQRIKNHYFTGRQPMKSSALRGPVKVCYPSVDFVYRSAFPLVRVEIYPN